MLSKRLQTIADLVPNNSRVIDVGCDHGLLSIYLANNKSCYCIATDVRQSALDNAIKNISKYNVYNVETVLTDGLDDITINIDDYIVIAGMGAYTIMKILKDKQLSDHLIVSSHNHVKELRKFLVSIGYKIDNELFVLDKGKEYIILELSRGKCLYSDFEYEYGPILLKNTAYLKLLLSKKERILECIPIDKYQVRNEIQLEIDKLKQELC